jgi:prolyl oligopeptidase
MEQVDILHGREIRDPYRWLEDLDSAETRRWIADQNALTEAYLARVGSREAIRDLLTRLWNFERFGVPEKAGGRYFYLRNQGLENQSVLYVQDSLEAEPRVLLDPNTLSGDGTVALMTWAPSRDGSALAYSVSSGGSDWQEIRIRNVDTGQELEDRLEWVKFSLISWTSNHPGFFYSRYDAPARGESFAGVNFDQKLFYHRIGTGQDRDVRVAWNPEEKEWGFLGQVTEDGRYLIVHVRLGTLTRNAIFYMDLDGWAGSDSLPALVPLLAEFDASYDFVGNAEGQFWFRTDRDAPRGRLVAIDIASPERNHWREILPQSEAILESAHAIGGGFVANYLEDAHSRLEVCDRGGRPLRTLELPDLGSVSGFSGRVDDPECFYAFTSFTLPTRIYRYDAVRGEQAVFRQPVFPLRGQQFRTRQVFYPSRDGTRVPMFLVSRRDLDPDTPHPTLLYGYGGFNISLTPAFAVSRIAWLEMGGVYAVANVRGGGEYGEEWHESGICRKKQNGIDDFLAAAEWLIASGRTRRDRLAIHGGSNGGMLVGAAANQRPELFAAVVPAVGVMDLLRFHRFTIGWAWTSDYGSPDDPEDFEVLSRCSPYHNVREGVPYPATLVVTGDHDDRVVPSHSFKFAAALQHAQAGPEPVLIRVAVSAGHGAGKPTNRQIEEAADILAFLRDALRFGGDPDFG